MRRQPVGDFERRGPEGRIQTGVRRRAHRLNRDKDVEDAGHFRAGAHHGSLAKPGIQLRARLQRVREDDEAIGLHLVSAVGGQSRSRLRADILLASDGVTAAPIKVDLAQSTSSSGDRTGGTGHVCGHQ